MYQKMREHSKQCSLTMYVIVEGIIFKHERTKRLTSEFVEFLTLDLFDMSISLKHVMTVVPLRKPREKLWARRTSERGKASQITDVLAKFEEADDRKSGSLSWQGRDKGEAGNRPTISGLKGFARESPGM